MVSAGDVTLNPSSRLATRHGKDIPLTRKQFELLNLLMERRGLSTSREQLIEAGWGRTLRGVKENTLDVTSTA